MPDWIWASPASVAEAGLDGMLRGRRTVTPGLANRIALGRPPGD